jgi:hypothetical protein
MAPRKDESAEAGYPGTRRDAVVGLGVMTSSLFRDLVLLSGNPKATSRWIVSGWVEPTVEQTSLWRKKPTKGPDSPTCTFAN